MASMMRTFDFLFGCRLGNLLLGHTDTLRTSLQAKDNSAADGQAMARMEVDALQKLRSDKEFDAFWTETCKLASDLGVAEAQLPRKRRPPRRLDDGTAPDFPATVSKWHVTHQWHFCDSL